MITEHFHFSTQQQELSPNNFGRNLVETLECWTAECRVSLVILTRSSY